MLKLHLFALPLATATHSQTHEPFNKNIAFQVTYLLFSLIIYQVIVSNIRSNKDDIALERVFHNWPSHDSNVRARGSFEVVYGYRRAGGLPFKRKDKIQSFDLKSSFYSKIISIIYCFIKRGKMHGADLEAVCFPIFNCFNLNSI